jgi:uncharacterized membrane protein YphA (DoxX/SURF4 family)
MGEYGDDERRAGSHLVGGPWLSLCDVPATGRKNPSIDVPSAPESAGGRRRFPLNNHRIQIGMAAAVVLVVLRLSLGWHFLYEGVWKIKHRDEFTAEPFLTQAKGPLAGLFYAMIPDIQGRQRLRIETDPKGKKFVNCDALVSRWNEIRRRFVDYYRPGADDEALQESYARVEEKARQTFDDFRRSAEKYLAENLAEIQAYFAALNRYEQDQERFQNAPFQKKRRWDQMQQLRREAAGWISELEARQSAYQNALQNLLDEQQRQRGPLPASWNPLHWSRLQQISFAVTYGLTAIGLCLMLGLFTRLAALGGAAFMAFVVLTTWAWPGTYPPDPLVLGHALLINKDFIELVALLLVASTGVGRWGGLDFFLHYLIFNRRPRVPNP